MTPEVAKSISPGINRWWFETVDDSGHPVPLAIMVRAYLRSRLGGRLNLPKNWDEIAAWIDGAIDNGMVTPDNCPLLLPNHD